MRKILAITVSALSLAAAGYGFAAAMAEDAPKADASVRPVFPVAKERVTVSTVAPAGAQYRIRSGKSGVRFVACNEQRAFGGNVEKHCLTFSPTKGWGKTLRWFPAYQLLPLTGELPPEPIASVIR